MSTYLDLPHGPEAATRVGARMLAEARAFKEKAQQVLADIQDADARRPWGGDAAGEAFEAQYHKPVGEVGPLAQAMQDRLQTAGDLLDQLGGGVVTAMSKYDLADMAGAADIEGAV